MLNDLIGGRVISIRERLWVPLDCYEALLDEILLKIRCICRLDYASTTLFGPVADWADEACLVHGLKSKRCVCWSTLFTALILIYDLLPVLLLPPAEWWAMEATCRLEQDVRTWPHFIIDSTATREWRHGEDQWVGDQLRLILLEQELRLLDIAAMVGDDKDILGHFDLLIDSLHRENSVEAVMEEEVLVDCRFSIALVHLPLLLSSIIVWFTRERTLNISVTFNLITFLTGIS